MGLIDFWNTLFNQIKGKKTKPRRKVRPKSSRTHAKTRRKKSLKTAHKPRRKTTRKSKIRKRKETVKKTKKQVKRRIGKQKKPNRRSKSGKSAGKNTLTKNTFRPHPAAAKMRSAQAVQHKEEIGMITHYFNKISVGIIKLKKSISVGDTIHIKGIHDDFKQVVSSMQINRVDVKRAGKNDEIGIKVARPVHENDRVYRVHNSGQRNG